MAFMYKAARSWVAHTDVVTVAAEGYVTLGTKLYFRFVVDENSAPGLNAKVQLVVEPPTGIHSQLMVSSSATAELSVPVSYDRIIASDGDGEHTVYISQPPFNDWPKPQ